MDLGVFISFAVTSICLVACNQTEFSEGPKFMAAISQDYIGQWVYAPLDCSQATIVVTDSRISESGIKCSIESQEQSSDGTRIFRGQNCKFNEREVHDFSFSFTPTDRGVFDYTTSETDVTLPIKRCSFE